MKNLSNRWRRGGAAVWIIALLALLAWAIWGYGDPIGLVENHHKVLAFLLIVAIAMVGHLSPRLLMYLKRQSHREQGAAHNVYPHADTNPVLPKKPAFSLSELQDYLRENHGLFWRFKIRLLLVVGEKAQIDTIAPGLKDKYWLAGHDTILLWGGTTRSKFDDGRVSPWQGLSRWRALDGVVWALTSEQSAETRAMDEGVRHLKDLARQLHWHLPLHLWQVCDSPWEQDKRQTQPVGCLLPFAVTPLEVESGLESLVQPLRSGGWAQVGKVKGHDFLLRLSRDLQAEGIARWRQALAPLFRVFARGIPLRGLWFSLPLQGDKENQEKTDNLWHATPAWEGVLGDKKIRYRRLGWGAPSIVYAFALGLMLLWGAGLLLSYASNRVHIAEVQTALVALDQAQSPDEQFLALNELTRELGRLDYRAKHGTPWYQRFGLNQNDPLLATLWPRYVEANTRLMRDPAVANLERQLTALINLPPASPQRAERVPTAHAQLKAYLMLARPEKVDATFLSKALTDAEPLRDGVSPGLWQTLSPSLWQFYAEQLVEHPEWWIQSDPRLITQTRQVLLGQLGQRNAETSLYQKVLDDTAHHYPALGLQQLVGDTDARALFVTDASIPGVFTRQAWEGQVRKAIDAIAEARREEIDWVLSDQHHEIAAELTPDELKAHLTERYFQDYANAWLGFLNSLRWQPVSSLGEVIDQLTLMSDVRQSPLIALMNTLAYQGQAGTRGQGLTDSLVKSAQKLIAQDKVPAIEQQIQKNPLDASFGPLLNLLKKDAEGLNDIDRLTLQAFLNRVTRVRLKLQQVSNATNPQAMTQALAQSVFQGQNVDLTDTQSYASLVAASLGAEWDGIGQTLFVQPLEQAWQRVLQPSTAGLNSQWQRSIVNDWHGAFAGRYPFAATASDASLPMLGQMIRGDSGRIEQFLQQQLGGVLRKEGSRWVADSRHSQGLRFNPQFLTAINQLSHLADVLYTDGGMGISFELRGKPVRDVVQTTFILNGEKHHYFNQKESWQRFKWPGFTSHPGTSLSWTSVRANERLFGDFEGTWGLIRLLEQAQVTPLNDSHSQYRLQLKAPDGIDLTWNLRTELGAGPLALLNLRDFKLPKQIFLEDKGAAVAQNGSLP